MAPPNVADDPNVVVAVSSASASFSQNRKAPIVRRSSSAFLRKPVPPRDIGDNEDENDTTPTSPSSTVVVRHRKTSGYNSIELEDGADNSDPDEDALGESASSSSNNNNKQQQTHSLERHLSLLDLIAVGIGGTVGTGLFVLAGLVAHEYAGPSTVLSWLVAGIAALLSGCCYAELSSRIPLAGSAYAYSYVAMGELPAVLAAACLTLEYVAASAAVARSWGDKSVALLKEEFDDGDWIHDYFESHGTLNPLAFIISSCIVMLLLTGVKESKAATNFFTALKVGLVCFMILAGFCFVRPTNWTPFIPPQFGVAGVFRGATGTFSGYLGYDQVCCLGGEVKNPKKNLPRAIMGVLIGVTVVYMTATLALTGMQPYQSISTVSGFPEAFYSHNANLAGQLIAIGEIVTLPIVVLITIMSQPRLQYAMAVDGLLPPMFREVDAGGNLWMGTLVSGALMILVATFIPFTHLNDMISCAVLMILSITDTSLVLVWHEPSDPESLLAEYLMLAFNGAALITSVALTRLMNTSYGLALTIAGVLAMVAISMAVYWLCPRSDVFGGHRQHYHENDLRLDEGYFRTPLVPFWPCLAIFINWYLIAQLNLVGIAMLLGYLGLAIIYYFCYAAHHSVGNNHGWPAPLKGLLFDAQLRESDREPTYPIHESTSLLSFSPYTKMQT